MAIVAYALPIVPGQAERAGRFAAELEERGLRSTYDELNRAASVRQHLTFLQPTPMGDLLVTVFDVNDPTKLLRPFGDSAYDSGGSTTCATSTGWTCGQDPRRHCRRSSSPRTPRGAGTLAPDRSH
jgi:hypothetical protein